MAELLDSQEKKEGELPKGHSLGQGLVDGASEIAPQWDNDSQMEVKRLPKWVPEPCARPPLSEEQDLKVAKESEHHVVLLEKAEERTPQNNFDLYLWGTEPGSIQYAKEELVRPHISKQEVPFVPGAFVVTGVLTKGECAQLIGKAEVMGFRPDHPTSKPTPTGIDSCEWFADESVLGPIFERIKPHLPPRLSGCDVAGVNARWRMFKYGEGAVYRPHIDGSWPASVLSSQGKYELDETRRSRLTFLVYLNEGFEGGTTTFYLPSPEGGLEARGVDPQAGAVLCFPQGNTASLVHEGSVVTSGGCKYVIRSDVLYTAK